MAQVGVVKFFNDEKGFGFITPNDGSPDLFVHRNEVTGGGLLDGDEVNYDDAVDDRNGKPKAMNVTGGTGGETWGKGTNKGKGGGGGGGGKGGKGGGGQVCRQFQQGNCSYGDSCRFAHVMGDGGGGGFGGGGFGGGGGGFGGGGYGGGGGDRGYGGGGGGYGGGGGFGGGGYGGGGKGGGGFGGGGYGGGGKGGGGFGGGGGGKGGNQVCRQFQQGECSYGDNCRFVHER